MDNQFNKNIMFFSKDIQFFMYLKDEFKVKGFNLIIKEEMSIGNIIEIMPQVIIIDGKNSINTISVIKNIKDDGIIKFVPILVFGPKDENLKIKFLSQGAIDYLYTPLKITEIIYKVKNLSNLSCNVMKNQVNDWLTGTYTKRHGKEICEKEFLRVKEKGGKLTLLLIDMDNMAEINLNKGLDIGNKIIKDSVDIFKKYINLQDIIYRMHGDSFVIMFNGKDVLEIFDIANKMQKDMLSLSDNYNINISFSGGISTYSKDIESYDNMYDIACELLKKAKRSGKKKTFISDSFLENFKSHKILFLDDDKIILSILNSRYKSKGYQVYSMNDPYEALKFIKENNIDLVVTDFYMSSMQGDRFIKEVRGFNSVVKIMVFSGQKDEKLMERVWELGADDYLPKPFSPIELDLRLKKLLNTR